MKQILIISYYYPPAGGACVPASLRMGKFVKYLPEHGWTPIVFSTDIGSYSYIDDTLVDNSKMLYRILDPIRKFKGRTRLSGWLPSPGLYLPWVIKTYYSGKKILEKTSPEIIMATTPPNANLLAGFLISKYSKIPLILDYRDQWTINPYRKRQKIYRKLDHLLEKIVLNQSTMVLVTNEGRLTEHINYWGEKSSHAIVIPNGFDLSDFDGLAPYRTSGKSLENEIIVRYMGNLYGSRIDTIKLFFENLFQYLSSSNKSKKITIQFIGSKPNDRELLKNSSKLHIEFVDQMKYKDALRYELGADILLLVVGSHSQSNSETSSKIFEYLASGNPILIIGESAELRKITYDIDRVFWISDYQNPEIFHKLFSWIDCEKGKSDSIKNHVNISRDVNYPSRKEISEKLAHHLSDCINAKN